MKPIKDFLEKFDKFSEKQLTAIKKAVWVRVYLTLGIAILVGVFFYQNGQAFDHGQLLDLKLAITLVIVEVPLLMFGGVIARIVLNESRQQAKEIGEEVGKQLEKIPVVNQTQTANQNHIDDHCDILIKRFKDRSSRAFISSIFTELDLYNSLPDKEQLLQHFYTGHSELLYFLKKSVELEKEMDLVSKPIQNQTHWKGIKNKYDEVHILYRNKITELLDQIDRKSTQLGGVCNECKKWYDSTNENFKQIDIKLNSYIIPF